MKKKSLKRIFCLALTVAMMLTAMNVLAASGFITNSGGSVIGYGFLSANGASASASTTCNISGGSVTTKVRYASERETGAWSTGGTSAYTTPDGVSGTVNIAQSSHQINSYSIGLTEYL